jgi:hypothetical protein
MPVIEYTRIRLAQCLTWMFKESNIFFLFVKLMDELGVKDALRQTTSQFPQPAAGSADEFENNLKALEVEDYRLLEAGVFDEPR